MLCRKCLRHLYPKRSAIFRQLFHLWKIYGNYKQKVQNMSIKSITIKRSTQTKNGYPVTDTNIEVIMQKPHQQPTQAEALDMLAEAIRMVIDSTKKG